MNLHQDILTEVLSKQKIKISFENLKTETPDEVVEMICYKEIQRIKKVLDNDGLDDFECIERIVKLLEEIGSNGGASYDFG